jgi:hypothetical protein
VPDLKPPRVSTGERETLQILLQYQRDSRFSWWDRQGVRLFAIGQLLGRRALRGQAGTVGS